MRPIVTIFTPVFPADELHPAFFLDRDDTLIFDVPYLRDPAKVRLTPGAIEGLKQLRAAGWRLILVSNQSGINRGKFTEEELRAVLGRMNALLASGGVQLDALYNCPHTPDENCACRKPGIGLFEQAQRDFNIDMAHSVMCGDKPADIQSGRAAGLRTIQLRLFPDSPHLDADYTVNTIAEAAMVLK